MKSRYLIFIFFNILIYLIFGNYFPSYIILYFCLSFLVFVAFERGRFVYSYFFFIIMLVVFFYSLFSVYKSYPERIFNEGVYRDGYYEVTKHKFKSRQVGAYSSKDGYVEPSSRRDIFLKNDNIIVRVSCSTNESGCPFYNKYNELLYVKYFHNSELNKNFILTIKQGNVVYDNKYFDGRYFFHWKIKILFILFYLFPIAFLLILVLNGRLLVK